jgi:hypothetical protein
MFIERILQREKHLPLDVGHPVCRVVYPKAEKHVDRAVAKSRHMAHRPRRDQHAVGSAGGFGGEIAHRVQVASVGNAEFHIEPDKGARIGPVYKRLLE